ncbi:MAG: hypothetical protein ACREQM_01520 [Candidatus Dormibacteraceae bacterium]
MFTIERDYDLKAATEDIGQWLLAIDVTDRLYPEQMASRPYQVARA